MARDVESLTEFDKIQAQSSHKNKLIVLFFFDQSDEKSDRMKKYVNIWSEEDDFIDHIVFLKCNKERCNPDMFQKYNVEAIPTFLFIKNNEQVASPYTVFDEIPCAAVKIEAVINDLLNGTK